MNSANKKSSEEDIYEIDAKSLSDASRCYFILAEKPLHIQHVEFIEKFLAGDTTIYAGDTSNYYLSPTDAIANYFTGQPSLQKPIPRIKFLLALKDEYINKIKNENSLF